MPARLYSTRPRRLSRPRLSPTRGGCNQEAWVDDAGEPPEGGRSNVDELQVRRQGRARPAPTNGRRPEDQAKRHAEAARRKVAERRERQTGAAGWVAERASQWSLDGPDWR